MKYAVCEVIAKGAYLREIIENQPAENWSWVHFSQYDEPVAGWMLEDPLLFNTVEDAEKVRRQAQLRMNDIRPGQYQTFVVAEVKQANIYNFVMIETYTKNEN